MWGPDAARSRVSQTAHPTRNVRQAAPRHDDPVRAVILTGAGTLRAEVHADGPIEASAADWRGGWYIAGRFTQIDGAPAPALAHVSDAGSLGIHPGLPGAAVARFTIPGGHLDTSWVDQPVPCRSCYAIAYAIALGQGRLFETPGIGRWPSWLAAVSQATGTPVASWHPPRIPGSAAPLGLAYAGERLFVTGAGAIQRSGPLAGGRGLMTLHARSGALLPSWRPPASLQPARPIASSGQVLLALDPTQGAR